MSEITINKISIDKNNFFEIDGKIDKNNRKLTFNISFEQLKEIFDIDVHELWFGMNKAIEKTKYIYVLGNDGRYYSCIECIFSIHYKDRVTFSSVAINLILENILTDTIDIKVKKVTFRTSYFGHSIHSAYIKSYNFNYSSRKRVTLKTYTDENFHIDISVESKEGYYYNQLSKIIYNIIEMIMLIFGDIPNINDINIECEENGKEVKAYFEIVDKYRSKRNKSNGKEILGCIIPETINKNTLKKFEKFREDTKIIYDLYMVNVNSNGYKEIQNCNLIQIMEGLYKTIINPKEELRDIIFYYFNSSKSAKRLLTRRDKRCVKDPNRTSIFIYKANNHRNYLSHLNLRQNKNVFYKLENIYAYWKLCMCIRIFILEYLKINYDNKAVTKYISEIEEWAKKNKLRFSSRVNR